MLGGWGSVCGRGKVVCPYAEKRLLQDLLVGLLKKKKDLLVAFYSLGKDAKRPESFSLNQVYFGIEIRHIQ